MVFCEGKYGGIFRGTSSEAGRYLPEYGNSFSALFIGYCGLHMLLFWDSNSPLLRLVEALFIVASWSSFSFHYLDKLGQVDSDSMVMASLWLLGYVVEEFVHALTFRCRRVTRFRRRLLRVGFCAMWALITSFLWWYLVGAPLSEEDHIKLDVFELAFAIPIGAMVVIGTVIMLLWRQPWFRNEYIRPDVQVLACRYFYTGVVLSILAFAVWYPSEHLCGEVYFWTVFPGHVFWHLLMPLGCVYMMLLPSLLMADIERTYPIFKTGIYFSIFPAYDMSASASEHQDIERATLAFRHTRRDDCEHTLSLPSSRQEPLPNLMGARQSRTTRISETTRCSQLGAEKAPPADDGSSESLSEQDVTLALPHKQRAVEMDRNWMRSVSG
eukprot:TRINITY_DN84292_c0_g1_i1.p1 TRINITY_DN84292_c0_g1~~TRINITY_DN84292_c0_g1_i1.p1  ORF type:complete len:383 (-),score=53.10 TRINITY_DN84292_c0_g1_i1:97-1245(-)